MSVKGYLVFVPFENVASMEYGGTSTVPGSVTRPDRVTVATVPGHLAGPFDVERTVRNGPSVIDCIEAAMRADPSLTAEEAIRTVPVSQETIDRLRGMDGNSS